MRTDTGLTVRRQDYLPFPFSIPKVSLEFELQADLTAVRAELTIVRKVDVPLSTDLVLDGREGEIHLQLPRDEDAQRRIADAFGLGSADLFGG